MDNNLTIKPKAGKFEFLDGLRGLMAINVIICHFICVYFPQMYFEKFAEQDESILTVFAKTPLSILVNGDIAVRYFFVLTGLLVGISVFTKKPSGEDVIKKCANRYFRLLPIVLLATLFTYVCMVFGLQNHLNILDKVPYGDFLDDYCNFTPSIMNLLKNIFFNPFCRMSDYVGPFWTIRYEFWGYVFSMVACYVLKDSKYRRLSYIAVSAALFVQHLPQYIPFFLGIFVADLLFNKNETLLGRYYENILHKKWFWICCYAVGLYFAACPMYFTGIYSLWGKIPYLDTKLLRAVGIALIIFVTMKSSVMQRIFEFKLFRWLGKISFEVYAIHWPLMLSVEAGAFMMLINKYDYNIAACLAFAITLPLIYISAILLHILVRQIEKITAACKSRLKNKLSKTKPTVEA